MYLLLIGKKGSQEEKVYYKSFKYKTTCLAEICRLASNAKSYGNPNVWQDAMNTYKIIHVSVDESDDNVIDFSVVDIKSSNCEDRFIRIRDEVSKDYVGGTYQTIKETIFPDFEMSNEYMVSLDYLDEGK